MGATTLEQKTEHATWVTYTRGDESHQTVVHSLVSLLRRHISFSVHDRLACETMVIGSLLFHENAFAPTSRPEISAPPSLADYLRCVVPPS